MGSTPSSRLKAGFELASSVVNLPATGILLAAELSVLLGATVRAFNAEARIEQERDGDIREAIAGYESGRVIPALAVLFERVEAQRSAAETMTDALVRSDVSVALDEVVSAGSLARRPRLLERRLVARWTALGWALAGIHVSAPLAFYSVLIGTEPGSFTWTVVGRAGLGTAIFAAVLAAVLLRIANRSLSRAIREGRNAA